MAHETTKRDPERIYLEPWPYSPEGRLWSEENVWPLYTWPPEPGGESERASGVEYIRADLHAAEIARLTRELEEARERARHREHQRDAAEAEVQRLRAALLAVRECAHLATAKRIAGEALYTTIEGDSRMDTETRQGLAAEERRALAADTEVSDGE